jgi:hypothetical protein
MIARRMELAGRKSAGGPAPATREFPSGLWLVLGLAAIAMILHLRGPSVADARTHNRPEPVQRVRPVSDTPPLPAADPAPAARSEATSVGRPAATGANFNSATVFWLSLLAVISLSVFSPKR